MDKLKPVIKFLKRHGFWIVSLGVLLLTILSYRSVANRLEETRVESVESINREFKQVTSIKTAGPQLGDVSFHPNEGTHDGMQDLINKSKKELKKAWQLKFDQQQELLFWDEDLGEPAIKKFEPLIPIEKVVPFTVETDAAESKLVPASFRNAYRELIVNVLPKLAESIGDAWQPLLSRQFNVTAEQKEEIENAKRVVIWNNANQSYWESHFTNYGSMTNPTPETPRVLQVLYAQEDLWILRSVLEDIIKKTNGDASANDLAKIKEIDHIYIGHDAQGVVGTVTRAAATVGAATDTQYEGYDGGGGGDDFGGYSSDGGSSSEATYGDGTLDPANGRYVDRDYLPLSATTLRESFVQVKKELAYLAIAKRIPVRIGLKMDQRAVMELLVNCANARLPLEIKQVRVNAHSVGMKGSLATQFGAVSSRSGVAAVATGASGRGGSMEESYDGGGGGGAQRTSTAEIVTGGEFVVPVEIYGIIFLYNPPDEAALSTPEDEFAVDPAAEPGVEPGTETESPDGPDTTDAPAPEAPAEPAEPTASTLQPTDLEKS